MATVIDMGDGVVDQVCRLAVRCRSPVSVTAVVCSRGITDPYKTHTQIGAKHQQIIGPRTLVVCPRLGGPDKPHVQRVLTRLRGVRACVLLFFLFGGVQAYDDGIVCRWGISDHCLRCCRSLSHVNIGGRPVRDLLHAGALPHHAGSIHPSKSSHSQPHTHTQAATDPPIPPTNPHRPPTRAPPSPGAWARNPSSASAAGAYSTSVRTLRLRPGRSVASSRLTHPIPYHHHQIPQPRPWRG